jgi:Regulator of chromosome condensation (RCC1) repeat/IPT/TIG domain
MFGWGEAKMGQLGFGKHRDVRKPNQIHFPKANDGSTVVITNISAGFGHSAALSNRGEMYTWGFNSYGQTGHGDKETHWYPELLEQDCTGQPFGPVIKMVCGKYSTFAIDSQGRPFSWGKGYIGHGQNSIEAAPKRIVANTENRVFLNVFANNDSALFYAPIRVYEIHPKCGPSKGGTQIQIVGTGFTDSDKLAVRFTYGDLSREVQAYFNHESGTVMCRTPLFEEF